MQTSDTGADAQNSRPQIKSGGEKSNIAGAFCTAAGILYVEHGDDGSVVSALRKIEYGEI